MNENELPSICPFCRKEHAVDLLKISKKSEVTCPACGKKYFIPYSEVKSMIKFQQDLEDMVGKPDENKKDS